MPSERVDAKTLVLLVLALKGRLGRRRISRVLRIGEGRARRILEHLHGKGLVEIVRGGTALTPRGREEIKRKLGVEAIGRFRLDEIKEGYVGVGFHVRGLQLGRVIDVRDGAVRAGARGALILLYEGGSLLLPPSMEDLDKYMPALSRDLRTSFSLSDGDVVILAFSEDLGASLRGALGALSHAWQLAGS